MTGLERTMLFVKGEAVDRPPFHPIIMRWAAKQAGVKYSDFCLDPHAKCMAMSQCASDYGIDWVTVMSDPWAEASAFGIRVEYPEDNLPIDIGGHFQDAAAAATIKKYDVRSNLRCSNRLAEISEFKRMHGNSLFIVGWVEGPVAEYVDLRKASEAAVDFFLDPDSVLMAMDTIVESAMQFITLQIEAGAHCIGIGDAFCSQIGPELYENFAFARQKLLVDHIHNSGALAKLHICGNTESILPAMISTGADIIDIDHLVPSMADFLPLLRRGQVFSGKADPVSVIQEGTVDKIRREVAEDFRQAKGRTIISAGCEITPGTSRENMKAFMQAAFETK